MGFLRTCVERLSRGKTIWRHLPRPFSHVRVLVTPDAALALLKPGENWCDVELIQMASSHIKPGEIVWDIGANVGVFGAAASAKCGPAGRVLCVEPDLMLAQLIRRTAANLPQNCAKIDTLPIAVGDCHRAAEFLIAQRGAPPTPSPSSCAPPIKWAAFANASSSP